MKRASRLALYLLILASTLFISSCGFHFRSATNIPVQLHAIYLRALKPYSPFAIQLKDTLRSLNIHLTKSAKSTPVTLEILNTSLTHSNPTITNGSQAIAYVFNFAVTVALTDSKGKAIVPAQLFETNQVIFLNPNEIYTINAQNLASKELYRDAISLIYHWLASGGTRNALNDYFFTKQDEDRANPSKSTKNKSH